MPDLWCVRTLGTGEAWPCRSRASATLMAADINAKFGKLAEDGGVILKVAVEPWPHGRLAHAEGLVP